MINVVTEPVVVIEELTREEAKYKVEEYFKEHGTAGIEELMINLRIPMHTITELIDELKEEGKIAIENRT